MLRLTTPSVGWEYRSRFGVLLYRRLVTQSLATGIWTSSWGRRCSGFTSEGDSAAVRDGLGRVRDAKKKLEVLDKIDKELAIIGQELQLDKFLIRDPGVSVVRNETLVVDPDVAVEPVIDCAPRLFVGVADPSDFGMGLHVDSLQDSVITAFTEREPEVSYTAFAEKNGRPDRSQRLARLVALDGIFRDASTEEERKNRLRELRVAASLGEIYKRS